MSAGTVFPGPLFFNGGISAVAGEAYASTNSYLQNVGFTVASFVAASMTSLTSLVAYNPQTAALADTNAALAAALYALGQKRVLEVTVTDE